MTVLALPLATTPKAISRSTLNQRQTLLDYLQYALSPDHPDAHRERLLRAAADGLAELDLDRPGRPVLRAPQKIGALLLDMDGTLVDSGAVVERHWRLFADRHGLDAESFLDDVHGVRSADVIAGIAPWLDAAAEAAALDAAEEEDSEGLRPVPGAPELLAGLPQRRWAVVTSAHRVLAAGRLQHVGLPVPEVMVCGDETRRGKPDPEGYLAAAAALGFPPAECAVVEDAPAGIEAGWRAGMLVVAITTNHALTDLPRAHAYVADLFGLSAALASIGRALPTP